MKETITKEVEFDSAHKLWDDSMTEVANKRIFGKCSTLHGHRYKLCVTVSGPLKNGMIINLVYLKEVINRYVVDNLDHQYLNSVKWLCDELTTCEVMAKIIFERLREPLKVIGVTLEKVRLYETPSCYAEVRVG